MRAIKRFRSGCVGVVCSLLLAGALLLRLHEAGGGATLDEAADGAGTDRSRP